MSNFNMDIKTIVKNAPRYTIQEKLKNQVQNLHVQGRLLSLAIQEKEDFLWGKKYVPTEIWHIEIHVKCMYLHSTHTS